MSKQISLETPGFSLHLHNQKGKKEKKPISIKQIYQSNSIKKKPRT